MVRTDLVKSSAKSHVATSNAPPKIVVVIAPKGGVGKSTLTMSLLVSARKTGVLVLGVNMDPQATLNKWAIRRQNMIADNPAADIPVIPVETIEPGNWRELKRLKGYDLVIVDTPPGHADTQHAIRSMCDVADVVLVPTSAAGVDLEEIIPFGVNVASGRAIFVLNRVNRRTKSFSRAKLELVKAGELYPSDIPSLEAIPTQYDLGLAVTDFGEPGAADLDALWHFVRRQAGLAPVVPHG
jgi:chromosome partitioning protein